MAPKSLATLLSFALAGAAFPASEKLTTKERVELIRGLSAEMATLKVLLPRSKKPLPIDSEGNFDKKTWDDIAKEMGPAGRVGDLVQITKVTIENDKLLLEINHGVKSGRKWYERVEVGMGNTTTPISSDGPNVAAGSNLAVSFPKGVPSLTSAQVKHLLAQVMDFERRTPTEQYVDTLPAPIKKAVSEHRVLEGMDRETVIMAIGKPVRKTRESKDGIDLEDWIYGQPPGKMTFVTFQGAKVVRVKDSYAGLGGSTAPKLPTP